MYKVCVHLRKNIHRFMNGTFDETVNGGKLH